MVKISAIMPVYNSEKYVAETIDSILAQSYENFEFIIVNDGSTDRTREIIEGYDDIRIKLFNLKQNKGVGYASNFVVEQTKGEYIARIDSDDIYHPDKFLLQKEYLDEHSDIALVKTFYEYFADEDLKNKQRFHALKLVEMERNNIVFPDEIAERLYCEMCIPNNSVLIRADILKEYGYKDMRIGEDYYLFYNLNKDGYRMGTVPKVLVKTRVSDSSITATQRYDGFVSKFVIKKDIIDQLFKSGNVYVWGSGVFGKSVTNILHTNNYDVKGFIDSNPSLQGQSILGLLVYSPDVINTESNIKVIVASQPGKHEIELMLKKVGFEHLKDYLIY